MCSRIFSVGDIDRPTIFSLLIFLRRALNNVICFSIGLRKIHIAEHFIYFLVGAAYAQTKTLKPTKQRDSRPCHQPRDTKSFTYSSLLSDNDIRTYIKVMFATSSFPSHLSPRVPHLFLFIILFPSLSPPPLPHPPLFFFLLKNYFKYIYSFILYFYARLNTHQCPCEMGLQLWFISFLIYKPLPNK